MEICDTCENNLQHRRILVDHNGPFCKPRYKQEKYCFYCEWKGTSGPGKQLREVIKEANTSNEKRN